MTPCIVESLFRTGSFASPTALLDVPVQHLTQAISQLRVLGYNMRPTQPRHPNIGQRYVLV